MYGDTEMKRQYKFTLLQSRDRTEPPLRILKIKYNPRNSPIGGWGYCFKNTLERKTKQSTQLRYMCRGDPNTLSELCKF